MNLGKHDRGSFNFLQKQSSLINRSYLGYIFVNIGDFGGNFWNIWLYMYLKGASFISTSSVAGGAGAGVVEVAARSAFADLASTSSAQAPMVLWTDPVCSACWPVGQGLG